MWGMMESASAGLLQGEEEDEEQGARRSRRTDARPRRSGRIATRDSCASCGEGGALLSCRRCPAAFHLRCCNLSMNEGMLPPGDWMCHRCLAHRKRRKQRKDQINGLLDCQLVEQLSSTVPVSELGAMRQQATMQFLERPSTPASSTSTDTATPSEPNDGDEEDLLDAEDEAPGSDTDADGPSLHLKKPFELLIAAAIEKNSTQFQLPGNLICRTSLPGTNKRRRKEEVTGRNIKRPKHELDPNGMVPLPVKVCFSCGRSCRLAPLIPCDLCPLLFHMDCMDPPLMAMPAGSWKCPNHMESFLGRLPSLMLSKVHATLSNRCQLFDRFQDTVSQNAIKLRFLHQAYLRQPPSPAMMFSHRARVLRVPDIVKSQYKCPLALDTPIGVRSGELICNGVEETTQLSFQHFTSKAEQQEWLQDIIALQCSIVKHLSAKQISPLVLDSEQVSRTNVKPSVSLQETGILCPPDSTSLPISCSKPCSVSVSPQGDLLTNSLSPSKESGNCCSSPVETSCLPSGNPNGPLECSGTLNACHQQDLHQRLTTSTKHAVKLENGTVCVPYLVHESTCAQSSHSISTPIAMTCTVNPARTSKDSGVSAKPRLTTFPAGGMMSLWGMFSSEECLFPDPFSPDTESLRSCVRPIANVELSQLDKRFVRLLAWQRIQQLFHLKGNLAMSGCVRVPSSSPASEQKAWVRARAAFYPLTGKGGTVNMCYRTLYIGTGVDMDVCLTNYGHCNYVSGKHACIFYDENTKRYELLNYSEHGTTVDDVLYSCDFSEKTMPSLSSSVVTKVQSIIRHSKKWEPEAELEVDDARRTGTKPALAKRVRSSWPQGGLGGHWTPCDCKTSSSSRFGERGMGWEGTALLHHGSCVRVGCLRFVFSVVEFAPKPPREEEWNERDKGTAAGPGQNAAEPLELHQPHVLFSANTP